MEQSDRQFWHIARGFLIRYNEYNRQKGASPASLEEFDHLQAKMLSQRQLKQSAITKLTSVELKSDYHNLILLAFLQDLAKWSNEYYAQLAYHPAPLQAILTQSIQVLNNQQQFHTIVAKQNELISALLPLPYTLSHLDQYKTLFRRLKDVKEYYPIPTRQHQKKCFMTAVEESIEKASKLHNLKVIQFIFGNIFNELEMLEENHEFISQRLRLMKKIVKNLWLFHEDIIYKLAYLIMKLSYQIPNNPHLYSNLVPIYDLLLDRLLQKPAMAALLLYKHLVLNNIQRILKSNNSCIVLQGLLSQLSKLFTKRRLEYFMRYYDWNYLQVPICQQSLNILYQYCENRANQRKMQHQLVKSYLNRIHTQIKTYLQELRGVHRDDSKWKFYELKKKEYYELVKDMNQHPKKLFKHIEATTNHDVKESIVQKYVRLIKKTSHLDSRAMINILSSDNPASGQLFAAYAELVLKQCKEHNLEEFIRLFTSNFLLTGESQQIARVLDTITKFYFDRQESSNRILKSSDATYTFANAILILNTDLHNPKNEQKISEQNFLKMCKKINEGEDIPTEILRKTYSNIKKNKINTFRDRDNMLGISVSNWLALCTDYQSLPLSYYDPELDVLDQPCLQYFIYDLLSSIIDEKETAKLQLLVQRFIYDDKVFQCEIIEVIRKVVDKKPHLPLHILEKIFELANFKHNKPSDKTLSYYWLAANLMTTFPTLIPTNIICEWLVLTWDIRTELQDNMHLRLMAEIKRIKQCIRTVTKREAKKSIMDMFSNFLSFKESDDDEQEPSANGFSKRTNFKNISNNVLDIIKYQDNQRRLAIEFLMSYIHKQESKVYEQFVSCLFLTFNLLYLVENCEQIGQDLFYELLGAKESSITKRLANLGKKDPKLFNILSNYCKFWILKLLLKEYTPVKLSVKQNNTYQYMLTKSLDYLAKVDKEILMNLVKEVQEKPSLDQKIVQAFENAIKKVYSGSNAQEIEPFLEKFKKEQNNDQGHNLKHEINKKDSSGQKSLEKIVEKKEVSESERQPEENLNQKKENQGEIDNKGANEEQSGVEANKQSTQLQAERDLPSYLSKEELQDKQGSSPGEPVKQGKGTSTEDMKKKRSLQNQDEEYIDPDAMIEQIDRQIEYHRRAEEKSAGQSTHRNEAIQKEEPQGAEKPAKREGVEEAKEEQDSPSIPVIMF